MNAIYFKYGHLVSPIHYGAHEREKKRQKMYGTLQFPMTPCNYDVHVLLNREATVKPRHLTLLWPGMCTPLNQREDEDLQQLKSMKTDKESESILVNVMKSLLKLRQTVTVRGS